MAGARRHRFGHRRAVAGWRPSLVAVACTVAAFAPAACSSDSPEAATTTAPTTTLAAGETAEIAARLAATIAELAGYTAAPATIDDTTVDSIFERWHQYDAAIAATDISAHAALRDALGAFRRAITLGDQNAMAFASGQFSSAASVYLAAHPVT